jgi:hypothetical protein
MVQVDVFWSYGLASGIALAARKRIEKDPAPFVNEHFLLAFAWTAFFFAPSGLYLLWQFPYWETMFLARDQTDIPAWLAVTFAVTNLTQGILGYWVTWRLIRAGKLGAARLQPIWSHAVMFLILFVGWDGSGFKRFSYAGTGLEWSNGIARPWTDWFGSPVFWALAIMGLLLGPSYYWVCRRLRAPVPSAAPAPLPRGAIPTEG